MRKALTVAAAVLLIGIGRAGAHTMTIGYVNSGPGSVTFWFGSWHALVPPLFEGSFNFVGSTAIPPQHDGFFQSKCGLPYACCELPGQTGRTGRRHEQLLRLHCGSVPDRRRRQRPGRQMAGRNLQRPSGRRLSVHLHSHCPALSGLGACQHCSTVECRHAKRRHRGRRHRASSDCVRVGDNPAYADDRRACSPAVVAATQLACCAERVTRSGGDASASPPDSRLSPEARRLTSPLSLSAVEYQATAYHALLEHYPGAPRPPGEGLDVISPSTTR